ncbi:TCP-1/cpn60 chaperonin family protein [Methanosarcina sp. 1.H.A.2.2]|uniref:TCP-1/cpn60 chaperonin family protein n=1 Tax=Methanosarcina sp. 1.H.A.2.2 TaxID=1483601 RepID=UPI0006226401|nr:TCP-1/cpn60 chaperonin family protein [Methanosarcina sp. 1.H.A.2.2]KKH47019.1 molecular chaperone Hsp60 [Methanosarcina sp. 1.H.A.2.2]
MASNIRPAPQTAIKSASNKAAGKTSQTVPGTAFDQLAESVREKIGIKGLVKGEELAEHLELVCGEVNRLLRSSFGPKGFDKLIINPVNEIVVTSDGKTILEEIDILHPAVTALKNLAKSMDKACGDGTKTAVILAAALITNGVKLIRHGVHPNTVVRGYRLAFYKAYELLEYSSRPAKSYEESYAAVLGAALGKGMQPGLAKELTHVVLKVVERLNSLSPEGRLDLNENVKVLKKSGGPEVDYLEGVIMDESPARPDMPRAFSGPSILILNYDLKFKSEYLSPRHDKRALDLETAYSFRDKQKEVMRGFADKIIGSKADVVFCEGDVDPLIEEALAREDILLFKKLKLKDLEKLSKATGTQIMAISDELVPERLGRADSLEVKKKCYENFVFIRVRDQPITSILVWEPVKYDLGKVEEAVDDALNNAAFLFKNKMIVTGGGGAEFDLAQMLRLYAFTLAGKEQLAVLEYANALEEIPRALARNAGMNVLDAMTEMAACYSRGEEARIDLSGKVRADAPFVYDLASIKKLAIISATETACSVLRVDEIRLKK